MIAKYIIIIINGVSFLFHSLRLKMCFEIRLLNLEFVVLDALIRHPTNEQFFISGEDQPIKHLEFCDTDIINASVDVILP